MKSILLSSEIKDIINSNATYVDKTKVIYNLIKNKGDFFLARPRRFWKTLTINTIIEIARWNKELFKDTYIWKSWYNFEEYPVIFLDMTNYTPSLNNLKEHILNKMYIYYKDKKTTLNSLLKAKKHKLRIFSFFDIIDFVYNLYNKKVFLLIDEYDKPIIENIDERRMKKDFTILSNLYPWIKEATSMVRFSFVTWLSKVFQQHTFSGLNNLFDITDSNLYYDLVGFTEQEIKENFKEHILNIMKKKGKSEGEILKELRKKANWYNYWDQNNSIFNSWSVLNSLSESTFEVNFWSWTWTLKSVSNFLKKINKKNKELYRIINLKIQILLEWWSILIKDTNFTFSEHLLYENEDNLFMLLLFAWYITKKKNNWKNYFIIPNEDARLWLKGLQKELWMLNMKWPWEITLEMVYNLINAINKNDKVSFKKSIDYIFSNIIQETPAFLFTKNDTTKRVKETEFQMILNGLFRCTNFIVQLELDWILGRADIVLYDNKKQKIYIFELKSFNKVDIEEVMKQWEKYVQQTKTKIQNITWDNIKDKDIYVIALSLKNNWILFDFKNMWK